jgi:hypothetical protein
MSGRGGGRNNGNGGRGHGRGQNYNGSANTTNKGTFVNLNTNLFEFGQHFAPDLMLTSWEKRVQYAGTNYRQDIINELQNKITVFSH